jgi:hypothetical protein
VIKHVVSYSQFLLPSCYPVEYAVTRFNARNRVQNGLGLFPNTAYMELNGRQDIPSGGQLTFSSRAFSSRPFMERRPEGSCNCYRC